VLACGADLPRKPWNEAPVSRGLAPAIKTGNHWQSRASWGGLGLGVWLSLQLFSGEAGAQSATDRALAETLYLDGRRLIAEGKNAEACTKFAESQRLDPATGTLLNLASCREAEGRLATAWKLFADAEASARKDGREDRVGFARQQQEELLPQLSRLSVQVPAEARVAGLSLFLDGSELRPAAWEVPMPLDGGPHEVTAKAVGYQDWTLQLELSTSGDNQSVSVPLLMSSAAESPLATAGDSGALASPSTEPAVTAAPPSAAPSLSAPDAGEQSLSRPVTWPVWVAGGATLLATGGAVFTGLQAHQLKLDYDRLNRDPAVSEPTARQGDRHAAVQCDVCGGGARAWRSDDLPLRDASNRATPALTGLACSSGRRVAARRCPVSSPRLGALRSWGLHPGALLTAVSLALTAVLGCMVLEPLDEPIPTEQKGGSGGAGGIGGGAGNGPAGNSGQGGNAGVAGALQREDCSNRQDDDGDTRTDCADRDCCRAHPDCREEAICQQFATHNGQTLTFDASPLSRLAVLLRGFEPEDTRQLAIPAGLSHYSIDSGDYPVPARARPRMDTLDAVLTPQVGGAHYSTHSLRLEAGTPWQGIGVSVGVMELNGSLLGTRLNLETGPTGLGFFAHNPGTEPVTVRLLVKSSATTPLAEGGSCDSGCGYYHYRDFEIAPSPDWSWKQLRFIDISTQNPAETPHPVSLSTLSLLGFEWVVLGATGSQVDVDELEFVCPLSQPRSDVVLLTDVEAGSIVLPPESFRSGTWEPATTGQLEVGNATDWPDGPAPYSLKFTRSAAEVAGQTQNGVCVEPNGGSLTLRGATAALRAS
jgi:hypothetical protein